MLNIVMHINGVLIFHRCPGGECHMAREDLCRHTAGLYQAWLGSAKVWMNVCGQ